MIKWSAWTAVEHESDRFGAAVYRIRLVRQNGTPFPMQRLTGIDKEALLSIGKTSNMERRRDQFFCGIENCYGHSEGNLLNLLLEFSKLKQLVPGGKVQYQFSVVATDARAKTLEAKLLKDYLVRFGELPPLNAAIPSRYDRKSWCEIKNA